MISRRLAVLGAAVACTGMLTACASSTTSATGTKRASERQTRAASSSLPSTPAPASATRSLSPTQLEAGLLRAADLPHGPFKVDDQGGTNPGGVYTARHSVVSDEPPVGGPFGVITNADSQPCSRLLNAVGYGKQAPTAEAWAEIGMVGPDGTTLVTETVASFAPGVASKIVSGVGTAGSTCRSVYSKRATGATVSGPRSLAMPKLGDANAGMEWPMSNTIGPSDNVLVVVQVGSNVVEIRGTLLTSSNAAKFDRTVLNQTLAKAVARLQAVSA